MNKHGRLLHAWPACVLAVLAGCGGGGGGGGGGAAAPAAALVETPAAVLELKQSASCDALKDYVSDSIVDLILNNGFIDCFNCAVTLTGGLALAPGLGTDAASFDEFTQTNTQERGVDELDIIEADENGNFYIVDGDHLVVANGLPPEDLREIASIDLSAAGRPEGLVLDRANGRLVVFLSEIAWFGPVPAFAPVPYPTDPVTRVLFVDVQDPANPTIERRLKIKGFRVAVRRIDDRVHIVTHHTPIMPPILATDVELVDLKQRYWEAINNGEPTDELADQLRDRVKTLVANTDINAYLPGMMAKEEGGDYVDVADPNCADVARPDVPMRLALTTVASVDSDGRNLGALRVPNNAWTVYSSTGNIYLIQASNDWWWRPDRQRQQTAIYKIAIGDSAPQYKALGRVHGWAGSAYQFSEHEGFLRVVTNRNEWDPVEARVLQDNNLFVLEDNNARRLVEVGAVRGFGKDENIFSSRFLADVGYVVTFRQIDPLFTFDLSNPRDPRLVGEVEIAGVSTYMHPLDRDHLLTIGFDGTDQRLSRDFRLQIFDVQKLDEPRLLHSYVPFFDVPGQAWTSAVYDPLAFNYFPAAGTLTLPVQYWAPDVARHFSGFMAFTVSIQDGFGELGRLDHSDLARERFCQDTGAGLPDICATGVYLEAADPRRTVSALLGDSTYMYTLSNVGMKVSPAADFGNAAGVLKLPYRNDYPWLLAP